MLVTLIACLAPRPALAQEKLVFTLPNGDCDGDNEVTLFDFAILNAAFGSTPEDSHWNPRADLDGDEEVTLFDYSILMRNFGQVGATPFSPSLPRYPLPTSGYNAGTIEIVLDGWQGPPRTVRVEALREDDPTAVYWEEMYTDAPSDLYLPDAGVWQLHISTEGGVSHAPKWGKVYEPGADGLLVVAQYPADGESFANPSFDLGPIGLRVVPADYDNVTMVASDGTRFPTNREREKAENLRCYWQLVAGNGALVPVIGTGDMHAALYYPSELVPFEGVVVQCTVRDEAPAPSRRDADAVVSIHFSIVNHPTLHISAFAHPVGGTPVSAGYNFPVTLRFVAGARLGNVWQLDDSDVRWETPWGVFTGPVVDVPIGPNEPHQRFSFSATATFRSTPLPPPVPPMQIVDSRSASRIMGFRKYELDECLDNNRGHCQGGPYEPQNWFDSRAGHEGHWGHALRPYGFDSVAANLNGGYIVYYAPAPFADLVRDMGPNVRAYFDWKGEFAPDGHQFKKAFRGRIYIFQRPTVEIYNDRNPLVLPIGLTAGGIDLVARCLVHELAHRRFFIEDFGGDDFDDSRLKTPEGRWKLEDSRYNRDGDMLTDAFENDHANQARYHCLPDNPFSILEWFTGSRVWEIYNQQTPPVDTVLWDQEMLARLWGEFGDPGGAPPYRVGDLDALDWSVEGRQDY